MVYILKEEGTSCYKIGFSSKKIPRVIGNQTGNPRKLRVILILDGDETLEAYLHRKYHQYKIDGGGSDWFKLPKAVISELKKGGGYEHNKHQGSAIGASPFDVRQVCGGQHYRTKPKGEDVSGRKTPFDNPLNKYPIFIGG